MKTRLILVEVLEFLALPLPGLARLDLGLRLRSPLRRHLRRLLRAPRHRHPTVLVLLRGLEGDHGFSHLNRLNICPKMSFTLVKQTRLR